MRSFDKDSKSPRRGRFVFKIVGWAGVALSVVGLGYHVLYLSSGHPRLPNPPYFFEAWYTLAGINVVLLVAGIVLGIGFIRSRRRWVPAFVVLQAVIALDSLVPGMLWLHPRYGSSIAAASGISRGTIFQVIILFPIWGSIAAIWAARQTNVIPHEASARA